MKLYCYPRRSRRDAKFAFYGEYVTVDDPQGYRRRQTVSVYRWLRRGGLDVHYARLAVWYMVAEPIAYPHQVEHHNDRRAVAS